MNGFRLGHLYLCALLQGLVLVSFPSSSSLLMERHGWTNSEYGLLFLPQIGAAIAGSLAGARFSSRLGLPFFLRTSLLFGACSQAGLLLLGKMTEVPSLLIAMISTGFVGLGFGLGAAPLNSYPAALFPRFADSALVGLHTCMGIGLAIGPLVVSFFALRGQWIGFPILVLALAAVLLILEFFQRTPKIMPAPAVSGGANASSRAHSILLALALLYAFSEGTLSNWVVLYLHEARHVGLARASGALSAFWATLAGGRLFTSWLVSRVPAARICIGLAALMFGVFWLIPWVPDTLAPLSFGLAGLACSSFFPLSVGLASRSWGKEAARGVSMMNASLMAGVGLGSFLIGPLRNFFAFDTLYRASSIYPVLCAILLFALQRVPSLSLQERKPHYV